MTTLTALPEILSTSPIPVLWASAEGVLCVANAAFEKQIGPFPTQKSMPDWLTLPPDSPKVDGWALWHWSYGIEPISVAACQQPYEGGTLVWLFPAEAMAPCFPQPGVEQLSQTYRDFVSVVSHEFRTPLTSIKGFADTLLRYGGQLQPEQQTKFITTIKDQASRLTRMVENLLTVSKLGEQTIELAPRSVALAPLLERVNANILAKGSQEPLYEGRTIDFSLEKGIPNVWADPDKLEQVLTNVIDNAVKYSFKGTPVAVTVSIVDGDTTSATAQLKVEVVNQGAGIPKEQLGSVFKRFSRADNPLTRQVEGTGLGLYITKNLVKAMSGHIAVTSQPNETTCFAITLPSATDARQSAYHATRETNDADED
jgi:two-component system phosphate regulon sensor histidine kinase PhoR